MLCRTHDMTIQAQGQYHSSRSWDFSEHGHVAYQIKENHECSNMVANILPADLSEHDHVAYCNVRMD